MFCSNPSLFLDYPFHILEQVWKLESDGGKASPSFQTIRCKKCISQMFTYMDFTIGFI
jgi:hypothetical protein